jgi:hypothetical protein
LNLDNLEPSKSAFLRGCLIGDGWLGLQRRKYVHLRIGHSVKQLDWLKWKAERINSILGTSRRVLGPYYQTSGDCSEKRYESYLYSVDDHETFSPWFDRWYRAGDPKVVKTLDADFLEGLGLQELAVLWCDDGSIHSSERQAKHRLKDGTIRLYPYVEGKGSIATCCFTAEENALLIEWIESLTGVKFRLERSKGYARLGINKKALREFIPQIAEYVPDCMKQKVDLSHCRIR